MSEFWFWHTSTRVALEQQDSRVFIVTKTFDPNGISLAREEKQQLDYPFTGGVRLEHHTQDYVILADETQYFAFQTNEWTIEREGVVPLMPKSEIAALVDDIFIFNSGKAEKFRYIQDKKAVFSELNKFPAAAEILDKKRDAFLFRGNDTLMQYNYSVNDENKMTEEIRLIAIDPKTAVYCKTGGDGPDFLYDDTRFYAIDNLDRIVEMTEDFALYKKYGGFLQWVYRPDGEYGEAVFEEKENEALWVFLKNGIGLTNGKTVYFYAIPAAYVSQDQTLIEMNGLFFRSAYAAYEYRSTHHFYMREPQDEAELTLMEKWLAEQYAFDASAVKNTAALRAFGPFFTDGELVYTVAYGGVNSKRFNVVQNLSPKAVFYPPVASFNRATSGFFDDKGVIKFFLYRDGTVTRTVPHTGKIKALGIAWLFGDKMLIENEVITSALDFETAELHESFVDVINGFSDAGMPPIEVAYRHYFKDKNGIYLYKSGSGALEKQ